MEECRNMNIPVKGPDVNESDVKFAVNDKGEIRFALSAIKGVGEAAVESLIEERKNNGKFSDVFDFIRRLNLRTVNKRVLESLAQAGAFDGFGYPRATFFAPSDKYDTYIEHILKYGQGVQSQQKNVTASLFGEAANEAMTPPPSVPRTEEWNLIQKLNYERDCVGIYLSGHPLDDYKVEVGFANITLDKVSEARNQKLKIAAFVTAVNHRVSKKGTGFGTFSIQDYSGSIEFSLFNEDYAKFKYLLEPGSSVFIEGEMKPRWNSEELELKIREIRQLANIADTLTESITLLVPIEDINEIFINNLEAICEKHKGKHRLKVHFLDATNRQTLQLYSVAQKVNVDTDFITAIQKMDLKYRIN